MQAALAFCLLWVLVWNFNVIRITQENNSKYLIFNNINDRWIVSRYNKNLIKYYSSQYPVKR